MNLGDPELELIDPTPNVHSLFMHFDKMFFWSKLASRAAVRWSKRMYSCAGTCSYECRAGFCDIALSEPLLKLRSRKDLVETLLHEMIHAFLFVTGKDRDRDGHGPNFQSHMFRINKLAGVNITIYHDFHDEVKLYQTHWWRCSGPCQNKRPYFGMVRRTVNRAPGPNDFWWKTHQQLCGGTFVKVKEPEKLCPKKPTKSNGDITKYIINNKSTPVNSKNIPTKPKNITKGILKDVNNIPSGMESTKKTKNDINVHIQQENIFKKQDNKKLSPILNDRSNVEDNRRRTQSVDVAEVVRNVWANKQLPGMEKNNNNVKINDNNTHNTNNDIMKAVKHKSEDVHLKSPPNKIRKIDNFITVAKNILKDVYGEDFDISISEKDNKLIPVKVNFVECPICKVKFNDREINRHLDECLNRDVIKELSKDSKSIERNSSVIIGNNKDDKKVNKQDIFEKDKIKIENKSDLQDLNNTRIIKKETVDPADKGVLLKGKKTDRPIDSINLEFDKRNVNKLKQIQVQVNNDKKSRKSGTYIEKEKHLKSKGLPLTLGDSGSVIKFPTIEVHPGTGKEVPSDSTGQTCPCCGGEISKPIDEHLDECLAFVEDTTSPQAGTSTSSEINTIVIDDDDIFDESSTLNSTGTKHPCPCCLKMIEQDEINNHLDICLSS